MEKIIDAWKGWRLEFEEEYGGDCDGACEYSTYSSFDWTTDLEEIIETGRMGWYTNLNSKYYQIYIEDINELEIKVHFTCGYTIELSKDKPEFDYRYSYGRGDYCHSLRLLPPGEKTEKLAQWHSPKFYNKCLKLLTPKQVDVPDKIGAVNLGLSVDWAPYDVGATAPGQLGDVFAWGQIVPEKPGSEYHMGFTDENGKHIFDSNGDSLYDFSGRMEDDAATVYWGEGWRTPRMKEVHELMFSCEWKWTKVEGVYGYKVTGKTGKSIFLPVDKDCKDWKGRAGSTFWISAGHMMPGGSTKGDTLEINEYIEGDIDNYGTGDCGTMSCLYIRPVKDK